MTISFMLHKEVVVVVVELLYNCHIKTYASCPVHFCSLLLGGSYLLLALLVVGHSSMILAVNSWCEALKWRFPLQTFPLRFLLHY